jgi:hypothetical protein
MIDLLDLSARMLIHGLDGFSTTSVLNSLESKIKIYVGVGAIISSISGSESHFSSSLLRMPNDVFPMLLSVFSSEDQLRLNTRHDHLCDNLCGGHWVGCSLWPEMP